MNTIPFHAFGILPHAREENLPRRIRRRRAERLPVVLRVLRPRRVNVPSAEEHRARAARGASATETTEALLPTPTARDWKDGTPCENVPTNALLGRTVWGDFGPYTAAITRWSAVLGRQAPPPTEPGTNGRPRLSPRFVEFMMGLPDGWVCDVPGITRTAQLKMLGNGVVWQQALLALSLLDPS